MGVGIQSVMLKEDIFPLIFFSFPSSALEEQKYPAALSSWVKLIDRGLISNPNSTNGTLLCDSRLGNSVWLPFLTHRGQSGIEKLRDHLLHFTTLFFVIEVKFT